MLKRKNRKAKEAKEPVGRDERTTAALLLKQQSALRMRFDNEQIVSRGGLLSPVSLRPYSCLEAQVKKDGVEFYTHHNFHTLTDNEALELARWLIRMLTPPKEF